MTSDGWGLHRLGSTGTPAPAPRPTLVRRDDDGAALLYAGGVHLVTGDPGVGKNWFAAWAATRVLKDGGTVLWVDGERNGQQAVESRLVRLGADDLARVLLVSSVDPAGDLGSAVAGALSLGSSGPVSRSLAVVDGALSICNRLGLDPNEAAGVDRFHHTITDPLVDLGFTVLVLLPRGKQRTDRARTGPSGSVEWAHRADVDFKLTASNGEGLRPGDRVGTLNIDVEKDRHGGLFRLCAETSKHLGTFSMVDNEPKNPDCAVAVVVRGTASPEDALTVVTKAQPRDRDADIANGFRAALADERRMTWTELRDGTTGNNTAKATIRDEMVRTGDLLVHGSGRGSTYSLASTVPADGTVPGTPGTGNDGPSIDGSVPRPPLGRGTGTVVEGPGSEDRKNAPAPTSAHGTENSEQPKATPPTPVPPPEHPADEDTPAVVVTKYVGEDELERHLFELEAASEAATRERVASLHRRLTPPSLVGPGPLADLLTA